ncbi:MAG: O-antigen ligase family protein [Bacteroidota bacterium]
MIDSIKLRWFYITSFVFVIANIIGFSFDFPWVGLLPFILIFIFLILFKLDKVLLMLAFLVPLSVNFEDVGFGLGISLPDEPLIMLIMCLAVFKFIIYSEYDYKVFRHPITIAIMVNFLWLVLTTFTSQHPFVSFKYTLSRFWYVIVFYFLGIIIFKHFKNIIRYLWLYIIPLTVIVVYTLYKHSTFGFTLIESYQIMRPFFIAHGIYAATLCFFVPLLVSYLLFYRRFGINLFYGLMILGTLIIFLLGIYFSYTRAAWIGLVVASCFLVPVLLRIRFNTILAILGVSIALTFTFQNEIVYLLSKNAQRSGNTFEHHFQSISNIKTDPSNTERINRWMSAISMFEERPVLGFGPGTYSFCYAPYQQSKNLTVISTNFGDGGNAHSEYLNTLSESGIFGLFSFLLILYFVFNTGFKLYYTSKRFKVRIVSLSIILGLITYFVHGFLNAYSETDKIGSILWAAYGMITALDIYQDKSKEDSKPMRELQ